MNQHCTAYDEDSTAVEDTGRDSTLKGTLEYSLGQWCTRRRTPAVAWMGTVSSIGGLRRCGRLRDTVLRTIVARSSAAVKDTGRDSTLKGTHVNTVLANTIHGCRLLQGLGWALYRLVWGCGSKQRISTSRD